jgi:nicotinamidase-related amidase
MALTTVDPHPALILVDLQKGIVSLPTVHPIDGVLAHAGALVRAFRARDLPVVLVNVAGGAPGRTEAPPRAGAQTPAPDWAEIVEELEPQPGDHRITKLRWGAFHETSLDTLLRELGVTQVFLGGVATSIGVESTARAAYEHGYNVVLVTDAMTDLAVDAHRASVELSFPRLGETTSTAEVLAMLDARPAG